PLPFALRKRLRPSQKTQGKQKGLRVNKRAPLRCSARHGLCVLGYGVSYGCLFGFVGGPSDHAGNLARRDVETIPDVRGRDGEQQRGEAALVVMARSFVPDGVGEIG